MAQEVNRYGIVKKVKKKHERFIVENPKLLPKFGNNFKKAQIWNLFIQQFLTIFGLFQCKIKIGISTFIFG